MAFKSLEDAVWNAESLADVVRYVMQTKNPNELFSDRHEDHISLLHFMIMRKSKEGIEIMLDIGADPNLLSRGGTPPLWIAIYMEQWDLLQLLVERGADINVKEPDNGNTPLHAALGVGREDVAQFLLDHGANPHEPNDLGITPQQLKLFKNLRQNVPQSSQGGLETWLNAFGDNPSEESMVSFLELCQTLIQNKVSEGKMSSIKAATLEDKINEFKNVLSLPEQELGEHAAKIRRMREIIDELKVVFTEDLTS